MLSTIELDAKQNCFEKWMTVQNSYHPGEVCQDRKRADQGVRQRHSTEQGICLPELVWGERRKDSRKGGKSMENRFIRVDEVAQELGVSKSYAYKIVQKLNAELKAKGYLTIAGRVSRQYFLEKVCYGARREEL